MNMNAATRALGRAESTLRYDNSAARLFRSYRRIKGLPDEISPEEIEGEKLQEYILTAGNYFANRCIARYFNDELEPSNPDNLHCLLPGTLVGYMGKHLLFIRLEVAPTHPDFQHCVNDDDYPTWYTSFRSEFENACNRFQLLHQGDEIFSGHDIHPLYRKTDNDKAGHFPHAKCDFRGVMLYLWKNATRRNKMMEEAAILCDTADAVGRPSESKFGNFSEWYYDWLLQCTNTPWTESKTLRNYGMSRICDDSFYFDWYANMGAFFMCEDGLARDEDQVRKGQMNSVFPSLQDVSNNAVTKRLTAAIRASLDGVPNDIRKKFSAKSLRKGTITEIAMTSFITIIEVCARSGHSTGTCIESYMDAMNPLRSLPAANALHGNPLNMKPVMPQMDAVGRPNREQVEKLMDELFRVDVPEFQRGKRLNIILEICCASLIRHLPEIVRLCGGHCLVASTLFQAAEKIGLKDARFPNRDPSGVLLEWSKIVGEDYKQNFNTKKLEAIGPSTHDSSAMYKMLSQVAGDVKELKDSKKDLELELASQKGVVAYQTQQIAALKTELEKERSKTKAIFKQFYPSPTGSPTTRSTAKRRRRDVVMEDAMNPNLGENSLESSSSAGDTCGGGNSLMPLEESKDEETTSGPVTPAASAPTATMRLVYTNEAFELSEGKGGNKGEMLRDVLLEMSRAGSLPDECAKWSTMLDSYPERWKRNRANLSRCLELVAFAGNKDDVDILAKGNLSGVSDKDLADAAARLVRAAHGKLLEFEGSSLENNDKAKRQLKTLVTGLSARIKKYKEACWIAKGKIGKDKDAPLLELDVLRKYEKEQEPGTPDGHRNLMSYYCKV